MPYLCLYELTVEPGKEQIVLESLRKKRGEDPFLNRYKSLEYFNPFINPAGVVSVKAEILSEKDIPKFGGYLKAEEHVKDIIIREHIFYPPREFLTLGLFK